MDWGYVDFQPVRHLSQAGTFFVNSAVDDYYIPRGVATIRKRQ